MTQIDPQVKAKIEEIVVLKFIQTEMSTYLANRRD